ncbi:hypothetical protein AK812_SmicGene7082 [Symbiodinium microadriaticum]|uniref:Uncharacterized protein n=1 Tax=Symbiodinium microadriaticum TaxID=2951 RepID=A0A1Q9EPL3_SYMMI|nr:hypothetical protein AK812_SmicGene7082 [Symbiodinium microadriaticum]
MYLVSGGVFIITTATTTINIMTTIVIVIIMTIITIIVIVIIMIIIAVTVVGQQSCRLYTLIAMLAILSVCLARLSQIVYDVMVSFFFSKGSLQPSSTLGYVAMALQMAPLAILSSAQLTVPGSPSPGELDCLKEEANSPKKEVQLC